MDGTHAKIPKNVSSGPHLEDELERDDNRSARRSTFEQFIELKEHVKALMELRILDLLSQRMNNEEAIFSKFISSKICLAYQKIGDVARAEKIAERLTFPSLSPKSLSPPLSPSSQSFSTASGSGLGSLSSSSSVSPDIPSFGEDNNKWDSNEKFNEPGKISSRENSEGEHHYRVKNPSQKDKNGRISISQVVMETPNEVSDGRNGVLKASFQGGDVFADSGENRDVLPTNGAYGLDKDWNTQAVALPKTSGDFHETNSKKKRSLGLKGGRRSDLPSGHSSQRDQSEDDFGTNHIGIYPSFLARHSCECRASDERWDSCGPCEDFELPVGTHSEYNRSGCMPEVYCPTPPSSSTLPECRDSTKFYAGDYSAYASTMGSPPQIYSSRDGYQPQKSSLNLVMPKTVSAKTLGLPQSSSLLEDGSKANLPLTVREFPIGNGRARTPPNIFPNGHVLAERPISPSQLERGDDAPGFLLDGESAGAGQGLLNSNSNTSADESLAVLEQRVAEACSLVERTLKERQEREKSMKETERKRKEKRETKEKRERKEKRKRKEKRERKEKQARERREREAREAREARETELMNERVEENSTSSGQETPSQDSAPAGVRQWLCEHYQRLCRVKFSCCGKFFPCHRCHNNSGCPNDNSKAREACSVECSVCSHQQEVNRNDIDLKFYIRGKRVLPLRL